MFAFNSLHPTLFYFLTKNVSSISRKRIFINEDGERPAQMSSSQAKLFRDEKMQGSYCTSIFYNIVLDFPPVVSGYSLKAGFNKVFHNLIADFELSHSKAPSRKTYQNVFRFISQRN